MITQNTIIGRAKQSVGNITFTTLLGKNVAKSKPLTVANPRTDAQVNQRVRLSRIVAIYRILSEVLSFGFKELAVGMYPYNMFSRTNMLNNAVTGVDLEAVFDPTKLEISKGSIGSQAIQGNSADVSSAAVAITWDSSNLPVGASLTDKALAVCYNGVRDTFSFAPVSTLRSANTISFDLPLGTTAGDTCHFYLGFYNATTRKSSDNATGSGNAVA